MHFREKKGVAPNAKASKVQNANPLNLRGDHHNARIGEQRRTDGKEGEIKEKGCRCDGKRACYDLPGWLPCVLPARHVRVSPASCSASRSLVFVDEDVLSFCRWPADVLIRRNGSDDGL